MTFKAATAARTRQRRDVVAMVVGYAVAVAAVLVRFGLDTRDADG